MNAANFVPSVIARYIPSTGKFAVFPADEEPKDTVKMYSDGHISNVPVDFYKMTQPLNESDKKIAIEEYKKAVGVEVLRVRDRMPYKKMRNIASRLSVPVENIEQAVNNAPADVQNVITQLPVKSKRSIAAERRWAADNLQSAMNEAKNLPKDATEEQKMALAQNISEAMTKMLMKIL